MGRAAVVLGVHPNTIRTWSEQGRLPYYRINPRGDRRYRLGDLQRFLADAERDSQARIGRAGRREAAAHPQASAPKDGAGVAARSRASAGTSPAESGATPALRGASSAPVPATAVGGSLPTRPARHSASFEQLASLAALTRGGRDLDRTLQSAARLIRSAVGATEVSIWEQAGDRLVRRAGDGGTSDPRRRLLLGGTAGARARSAVTHAAGEAVVEPVSRARGNRAARDGTGPEMTVPIAADGGTWGVVVARHARPLDEGGHELAWLKAAAGLLGVAVSSAALLDGARRELHRAEALRRVAIDTNGTLDIDETLARLLDHAMVLFGADRAAVFIRQADGHVAAEISRGLSAAYIGAVRAFPRPSVSADAMAARRPLFATNYRDDPRAQGFRAALVQEGFDTVCAAPLLDGGEAIGVLNLYHDRPKEWAAAELETMAAFASQATVAIRTTQQFGQLARWAAQLQSIQQLGARLNHLATVPEIGEMIATELSELIEYDNVRVYRLDGEDLIAVALRAHDEEYGLETAEEVRSRVGQGITGWVAEHGIAQNLPDASADPRSARVPGSDPLDESMLLAPLTFEDRVLGVLVLARRGLRQFADDDLRLLEIYASLAAQAMAHAEATELLRRQSETLERQLRSQRELIQITESILSTLDPRAVLDQIADRLGRLVRYDTIAIEVYDRRTDTLVPLTAKGDLTVQPGPRDARASDEASWVIANNQALLVDGPSDDRAWGGGDAADAAQSPSPLVGPPRPRAKAPAGGRRIVVPLRGQEGVTGILTLSRNERRDQFTTDEFELVRLFAGQVSIALQNAEIHRAVEVRARTDGLTGLLNHGSLREWLLKSAVEAEPFSLIMLDLDEFKAVNDRFGHQAGDRLLTQIAAAIVAAGRDTDLVFRYGGDEFAVLLPQTDVAGALTVAERIRGAVHRVGGPGSRGSLSFDITASIGVAAFPEDGNTAEAILLAADRACFVSKRSGRDGIALAAEGLALAADISLQQPTPVDPPSRSAA